VTSFSGRQEYDFSLQAYTIIHIHILLKQQDCLLPNAQAKSVVAGLDEEAGIADK
jgi:hypothetical protein